MNAESPSGPFDGWESVSYGAPEMEVKPAGDFFMPPVHPGASRFGTFRPGRLHPRK